MISKASTTANGDNTSTFFQKPFELWNRSVRTNTSQPLTIFNRDLFCFGLPASTKTTFSSGYRRHGSGNKNKDIIFLSKFTCIYFLWINHMKRKMILLH